MIIRALEPADLSTVAAIEARAMVGPWTPDQLHQELAAANGIAWVVEEAGTICGYAFFRTCAPECELLHLAVRPENRRRGLAAALLDQALTALAVRGCPACFLEVRASNQPALALYARAGFRTTGRRKLYYNQPAEDALLLCRPAPTAA